MDMSDHEERTVRYAETKAFALVGGWAPKATVLRVESGTGPEKKKGNS